VDFTPVCESVEDADLAPDGESAVFDETGLPLVGGVTTVKLGDGLCIEEMEALEELKDGHWGVPPQGTLIADGVEKELMLKCEGVMNACLFTNKPINATKAKTQDEEPVGGRPV